MASRYLWGSEPISKVISATTPEGEKYRFVETYKPGVDDPEITGMGASGKRFILLVHLSSTGEVQDDVETWQDWAREGKVDTLQWRGTSYLAMLIQAAVVEPYQRSAYGTWCRLQLTFRQLGDKT